MKLRKPDSSVQRVVIAVVVAVAIIAFVGWAFFLGGSSSSGEKVNGIRIVAAAQAFTRALKNAGQPIPPSVQLDELVAHGFLKSEDAAAFHGLDASVLLTGPDLGAKTVLMRVRLQDGSFLVLLADGSVQPVAR
jgi:hypothetical protein